MPQTYQELLTAIADAPCKDNSFIEMNKVLMCGITGHPSLHQLSDVDYDYFWGCMKLYETYGINYYDNYLKIALHIFSDFSRGLEHWLSNLGTSVISVNPYDDKSRHRKLYCKELTTLVEALKFFGLGQYMGMSIAELENLLENAPMQWNRLFDETIRQREEKGAKTKEDKINNYFNFADFSEEKYSTYVKACTIMRKKGDTVSIDEALKLAQDAPKRMYIVIFSRSGAVCYAGKSTQLFSYIGKQSTRHNADSVSFEPVDEDYADDVLLTAMIHYDLPLETVRVSKVNRKYATLNHACFAYKRTAELSRKRILDTIRKHNLRLIDLRDGEYILDKVALEKAIR